MPQKDEYISASFALARMDELFRAKQEAGEFREGDVKKLSGLSKALKAIQAQANQIIDEDDRVQFEHENVMRLLDEQSDFDHRTMSYHATSIVRIFCLDILARHLENTSKETLLVTPPEKPLTSHLKKPGQKGKKKKVSFDEGGVQMRVIPNVKGTRTVQESIALSQTRGSALSGHDKIEVALNPVSFSIEQAVDRLWQNIEDKENESESIESKKAANLLFNALNDFRQQSLKDTGNLPELAEELAFVDKYFEKYPNHLLQDYIIHARTHTFEFTQPFAEFEYNSNQAIVNLSITTVMGDLLQKLEAMDADHKQKDAYYKAMSKSNGDLRQDLPGTRDLTLSQYDEMNRELAEQQFNVEILNSERKALRKAFDRLTKEFNGIQDAQRFDYLKQEMKKLGPSDKTLPQEQGMRRIIIRQILDQIDNRQVDLAKAEPSPQTRWPIGEDWRAAKAFFAENLDKTKFSRKTTGFTNSFELINGEIYAIAPEQMYLGRGGEGKVKLCKNEKGEVFARKEGFRPMSKEERSILKELGVYFGEATRETSPAPFFKKALARGSYSKSKNPVVAEKHTTIVKLAPGRDMVYLSRNTDVLKSTKPVLMMFLKMAEQIYILHQKGILHRDVKPGNFVMDIEGDSIKGVQVVDFGFAKRLPEGIPAFTGKSVCGSPGHVAPEVLKGKEYSYESDMYALGAIIKIGLGDKNNFVKDLMSSDPIRRPSSAETIEILGQMLLRNDSITLSDDERAEIKTAIALAAEPLARGKYYCNKLMRASDPASMMGSDFAADWQAFMLYLGDLSKRNDDLYSQTLQSFPSIVRGRVLFEQLRAQSDSNFSSHSEFSDLCVYFSSLTPKADLIKDIAIKGKFSKEMKALLNDPSQRFRAAAADNQALLRAVERKSTSLCNSLLAVPEVIETIRQDKSHKVLLAAVQTNDTRFVGKLLGNEHFRGALSDEAFGAAIKSVQENKKMLLLLQKHAPQRKAVVSAQDASRAEKGPPKAKEGSKSKSRWRNRLG